MGVKATPAITAALAALALAGPAPAAAEPTPAEALTIGREAYEYGFPLLEFLRVRREMTSVRCPDSEGNAPVNAFSHAGGFARVEDRTVVAPNTDTLYSIAHLDLRKGPVMLSNPEMGKRYFSFELLDPFTNVIAIPGQRLDGGEAASYAIKWTKAKKGHGWKKPRGAEVIRTKYRRVWVIARTLATGERDQREAQKLMHRYRLTLADGSRRSFPKGCEPGEPTLSPTPSDGEQFVKRLNGALKRNPPPRRDQPLLDRLAPYGIGPGLAPEAAALDPATLNALHAGIATKAASLPTEAKLHAVIESRKNEGWYLPEENIGRYGTDYGFRAIIASAGLGANTREEAVYPVGVTDPEGALLTGINDYRLTFAPGNEPPAKFFWSLTMYDIDGYLVPNPIDRYSVGPSHPPLVERADGSIVIAIQSEEPTDPDVNWLPAPRGLFRLNLRLYGPRKAALNGGWTPPGLERRIAGLG